MEEEFSDVIIDVDSQNKIFSKTFFWMFLGLLGTAITAAYTYYSGLYVNIIRNNYFFAILIIEIAVVVLFDLSFRKFSPTTVAILYFLYSMITGVSFSIFFVVFELSSLVYLFVISSLIYGIFGYIRI